jgi:tetratricopeptide (TPR) repeat protein
MGQFKMQNMNPENPVVKLCVQGMEGESKGNFDEASRLFLSAWSQSTDDFERCIAAHYVARHQKSQYEALHWNQLSLDYARAVGDETVKGFIPSLYLNLGKAYEDLRKLDDARRFYAMAEEALTSLPDDPYGRLIRDAVERALERVRSSSLPCHGGL